MSKDRLVAIFQNLSQQLPLIIKCYKDGKTWAYLKFTGTAAISVGADWESQLRYWSSTNGKNENNLTTFRDATQKL
jgi:hypothetical protein